MRRACTVGAMLMVIASAGCGSSSSDSGTLGPLVGPAAGPNASPCKAPGPDVLLCTDFDDGSVTPLLQASFGGGTVQPSSLNAVSLPNSLHVKTVGGTEAAAALLLSPAALSAPRIQLEADLFIAPAQEMGNDADSSLLRVNLMDDTAMRGSFFIHYVAATHELAVIAHSDSEGDATTHSLGPVPTGWFHFTMLVSQAPGGGAFAQAQVGSQNPQTVSISGDTVPYVYTLEAGLNEPNASDYEAFLDNIVVRSVD